MKNLIFVFFATFPFLTFASTWVALEKIPSDILNDPYNRYVDIESLSRDGGVFSIWMYENHTNKILRSTSLVYVDCKLQAIKYDQFIVNGEKFSTIRGTYFPIPSEKYTTGRQLYNLYCK